MKKIYIVLTDTGTILSKLIKFWTKDKNTHSSIALDEELTELYSFGRLNPYNAFVGGFVKEGINIGTFKRFTNTKTQIYSLTVTDKQYNRAKEIIAEFYKQKESYGFNTLGVLLAGTNKKIDRKNKLYCAEFVKYVLENSDINMENCPSIIKPEDFKKMNHLELIYQGLLREYNIKKVQYTQ